MDVYSIIYASVTNDLKSLASHVLGTRGKLLRVFRRADVVVEDASVHRDRSMNRRRPDG